MATGLAADRPLSAGRVLMETAFLLEWALLSRFKGRIARASPFGAGECALDLCCWHRKVEPLDQAVEGFDARITGRKRYHSGARGRLAPIGCEPSTCAMHPGEPARAGRWSRQTKTGQANIGQTKTDCGIHRPQILPEGLFA